MNKNSAVKTVRSNIIQCYSTIYQNQLKTTSTRDFILVRLKFVYVFIYPWIE